MIAGMIQFLEVCRKLAERSKLPLILTLDFHLVIPSIADGAIFDCHDAAFNSGSARVRAANTVVDHARLLPRTLGVPSGTWHAEVIGRRRAQGC